MRGVLELLNNLDLVPRLVFVEVASNSNSFSRLMPVGDPSESKHWTRFGDMASDFSNRQSRRCLRRSRFRGFLEGFAGCMILWCNIRRISTVADCLLLNFLFNESVRGLQSRLHFCAAQLACQACFHVLFWSSLFKPLIDFVC